MSTLHITFLTKSLVVMDSSFDVAKEKTRSKTEIHVVVMLLLFVFLWLSFKSINICTQQELCGDGRRASDAWRALLSAVCLCFGTVCPGRRERHPTDGRPVVRWKTDQDELGDQEAPCSQSHL